MIKLNIFSPIKQIFWSLLICSSENLWRHQLHFRSVLQRWASNRARMKFEQWTSEWDPRLATCPLIANEDIRKSWKMFYLLTPYSLQGRCHQTDTGELVNAPFEGMHINLLSNCIVEKALVKSRLLFIIVDTTSYKTFCCWPEVFILIV